MPTDDDQRQAFKFLQGRFRSQEPFTRDDLQQETNWSDSSLATYWSKQFRPFVAMVLPRMPKPRAREQRYRVTDAFRACASWEKFRQHVTQVRRVSADYTRTTFEHVLIFEFYMPLTNEGALRTTLDALFYKDTLATRLKALTPEDLRSHFKAESGETDPVYRERLLSWLAKKFGGYSIGHVGGRFRSQKLATMREATEIEERGDRYLIDETTAVTRFIFPCAGKEEAAAVKWFFFELFVESIIQFVNGEDEIWLVESGLQNRLHTWKVES